LVALPAPGGPVIIIAGALLGPRAEDLNLSIHAISSSTT